MIDFVGSRKKHNNDKSVPDSYQFDPDHEGHWGKDSAWIADNMPRLLERNVPDVAVIHLGAEDIVASHAARDALTDGIVRNIDRVIKALRSRNEKVKIVIAETLPVSGREETSALLNEKISLLARSPASNLQPIIVSETNRELIRSQDLLVDELLPNAGGARKIATSLAESINPLLAPPQDHSSTK